MQADQFAPRFDAKLPAELREVVTKSIEDDPEKRFQSASAFRSALIAAARSLPASAPPPATPCARENRAAPPPSSRDLAAGSVHRFSSRSAHW